MSKAILNACHDSDVMRIGRHHLDKPLLHESENRASRGRHDRLSLRRRNRVDLSRMDLLVLVLVVERKKGGRPKAQSSDDRSKAGIETLK